MKTINKLLALVMILSIVLVPLTVFSDDSEAVVNFDQNCKVTDEFTDMGGGSITVYLKNDASTSVTVKVEAKCGDSVRAWADVTIGPKVDGVDGKASQKLSWNEDSAGSKYIDVYVYDGDETKHNSVTINVSHSIWKDTTTYLVIIIVIIVVVIGLWIAIRGVPGTKKKEKDQPQQTKVFTQMEEERKARKNAGQTESVPVEKQTYDASQSKRKSKRR